MYNLKFCVSEFNIAKRSCRFICKKQHHFTLNPTKIYRLAKQTKPKEKLCQECYKEERLSEIKQIIEKLYEHGSLLDTEYFGSKHKYEFSCGVKGHKPFFQNIHKLKERGLTSGCPECTSRTNIKRTEEDKLAIARSQNTHFTKEKGEVFLLTIKRDTGSTYPDVWSCSNHKHKPFILSIDNMIRRDQWCSYCTGRVVKKIPVEGVHYTLKAKKLK